MTASNTKSDTPTPHRHTTRIAHSPSLAARQGKHHADYTGELPVVGYVGRHRKPEGAKLVVAFAKRWTGTAS